MAEQHFQVTVLPGLAEFFGQPEEDKSKLSDLKFVCEGAEVFHSFRILFAGMSPLLRRIFKENDVVDHSDITTITLPTTRASISRLHDTILKGPGLNQDVQEDQDVMNPEDLLSFMGISLSSEKSPASKIAPEVVPIRKRRKIVKETSKSVVPDPNPPLELDDEPTIRRSKRSRARNQLLSDYETGNPKASERDAAFSSKLTSSLFLNSKEKVIENVTIKVGAPDEKALEVHDNSDGGMAMLKELTKICQICNKKLLGHFSFRQHILYAHQAAQGPYACPICHEELSCGVWFHKHLKDKHSIPCKGKGSSSNSSKKKFQCDVQDCPVTTEFQSFSAFKTHCMSVHKVFPLECKICHKRYKEQATFKNHMESHSEEWNYSCDICGKKFFTKERMFAHRRLHLGRRFQCSQCSYSASSTTTLRNHIRMKHQERKFTCNLCEKRFGSKQNLTLHQRIHFEERPHSCQLCQLSFKRQHHLHQHLKSKQHLANEKTASNVNVASTSTVIPVSGQLPVEFVDDTAAKLTKNLKPIRQKPAEPPSLVVPLSFSELLGFDNTSSASGQVKRTSKFSDEDFINFGDVVDQSEASSWLLVVNQGEEVEQTAVEDKSDELAFQKI